MKSYNVYSVLLFGLYGSYTIGMSPRSPKKIPLSYRPRKEITLIQQENQPSFPKIFNQKSNFENISKYRFVFVNRLLTQSGSRPKNHSLLIDIQKTLAEELLRIDENKLHVNYRADDLQTARHIIDLDKDCLACTNFINNNELYEAEKIIEKNPYLVHYYFIHPDYQTDIGTLVHYVLHRAAKDPSFRNNSCIVLHSLLKNGANPNATDKSGNTPAHLISSIKQIEILRKWGCSTDCKNKNEHTPLDKISFNMAGSQLEDYLTYNIVDFNTQNFEDFFKQLLLYQAGFIRKLLTQHGKTISHYNTFAKVQAILKKGISLIDPSVLETNYSSDTLHLIRCVIDLSKDCQKWKEFIENNEFYEAENLVEKNPYLVQYYFSGTHQPDLGTMIHYILNKASKDSENRLFRNNSYLILNSLLRSGANPNAVNRKGDTPMHLVSSTKHVEILLRWGAYTNQKNKASKTPLMKIYCDTRDNTLLAFLLYAGVNPDTQDINGDTVLHHATKYNDFTGCCTFLSYSASFMIPNKENKTPACYVCNLPHIKTLIEPYMHRFLWINLQNKNYKKIEEFMQRYPWVSLEHGDKPLLEWIEQSFNKKRVIAFKKILAKRSYPLSTNLSSTYRA